MSTDTVGQRILSLRKSKGLTQTDLAEKLGIGQSALNRWEKDKVAPREETIGKLSSFFWG